MKGTANTSAGGQWCGRAVHGVSSLCGEDMRQIEAHRAKERPTPWAHLALRYGVNEIDLRRLFEPGNDNLLPRPAPDQKQATRTERERRFRTMWAEGMPKSEISNLLGMSFPSIDKMRLKLGLSKRAEGTKPNSWSEEEDAYIRRHYIIAGETAEAVARKLNRTRLAVIGRAHRQGWTRNTLSGLAA